MFYTISFSHFHPHHYPTNVKYTFLRSWKWKTEVRDSSSTHDSSFHNIYFLSILGEKKIKTKKKTLQWCTSLVLVYSVKYENALKFLVETGQNVKLNKIYLHNCTIKTTARWLFWTIIVSKKIQSREKKQFAIKFFG